MELNELKAFLDRELTYPVDATTVREQVGDADVTAPDEEDTETIATLLGDIDDATYASATELFEEIFAHLPDEYIGRKYYDDRGTNPPKTTPVREDEEDQSL